MAPLIHWAGITKKIELFCKKCLTNDEVSVIICKLSASAARNNRDQKEK